MKATLQQYADEMLVPEYRQSLKTSEQVCEANGWGEPDAPHCCGEHVAVESFIGSPYYAECKTCGKFAAAVDGPTFDNASVRFLDPEKVDLDAPARWIVGTAPTAAA